MNKKSTSNLSSEIEKFIINAHQKYKLGADAISKKMALTLNEGGLNVKISRAPIGKRLTKLRKAGKIKHIPHKERQSSKNMRGQYYDKKRNTYLDIRPITAIDRKTRDLKTGKLKYKIPKDAEFKVDFKNPTASDALTTKIPKEFLGIQYFKTKKDAERAVARNQERIKK
tara:strand:- start:896 stop:1405 length:510 start_codon:yes stop_codon:yes gene_type:complete